VIAPALSSIKVGDEVRLLSRRVTQEQINAYAEASGDFNPIHINEEFARTVGLPGTIAHGMLNLGILVDGLARWAGGSDRVAAVACRFSKPLLPGDTITCAARVASVDAAGGLVELEVEAVNDRDERVLSNGRATVRLPR
jgi:acyl dehydratase